MRRPRTAGELPEASISTIQVKEINVMSLSDHDRREQPMTEAEYDRARGKIALNDDVALADLWRRSRWTRRQIGKREQRADSSVTRFLCYMRYLDFIATGRVGVDASLKVPERRFREAWLRTDLNAIDEDRFLAVAAMVGVPIPVHEDVAEARRLLAQLAAVVDRLESELRRTVRH
jgi:hypothetical protein